MRRLAVIVLAAAAVAGCGPTVRTVTRSVPVAPAAVTDHTLRGAILADERRMIATTEPYKSWMPGYRILGVGRPLDWVRFENLYMLISQGLQYWATIDVKVVWRNGAWQATAGHVSGAPIGAALVNTTIQHYARFGG